MSKELIDGRACEACEGEGIVISQQPGKRFARCQACDGDEWRESVNRAQVAYLLNEVDCRIEHGAESNGHLEYVRQELKKLLGYEDAI